MAYSPNLPPGQATMTNSAPVVIASDQTSVPISGSVTITPSGTQDVNLIKFGGISVSIGQQLAAASVPVILPSATITTLTPLSTVAVTQSTSPWVVSGTVAFSNSSIEIGATSLAALELIGVKGADGSNILSALNPIPINDAGGSITIDAVNLDIRDLLFASDKVDVSGSTLAANSGVDIGDVTVNNSTGAAAVNIQDGGNTITVDGTIAFSNTTIAVTNAGVFGVQENGAALTALQIIDNFISGARGLVTEDNSAAIKTAVELIDNAVSGSGFNITQYGGTNVDTNSGSKSAGTLRVVIATDQPQLTNKLLVTPDANSTVDLTRIGGNAVISAGTNGALAIGGTVATNVAITANPINLGAQAVSSENSAATTARQVQLVADLVGKLIVLPYSNPENFVSGVTAALTDTTSTQVIAAPAGSLRNYITSILVTNSHATVSTFVTIRDGSGGTIIWEGYALAAGGGFSITFPCPLRQPTTATRIDAKCETTGSNVIVSVNGYKGL